MAEQLIHILLSILLIENSKKDELRFCCVELYQSHPNS